MKTRVPKNTLVVYEGGGYEGCICEPNAFFWDAEQNFIQICATGRNGIHDSETGYAEYRRIKFRDLRGDIFRITCEKDMVALHKSGYYKSMSVGCVEKIVNHYTDKLPDHPDTARVRAHITCDVCGCRVNLDEPWNDPPYQLVGTVSSSGRCSGPFFKDTVVCALCFQYGQCRVCQFSDNDNDGYVGTDNLDERGYCEDHACFALLEPLSKWLLWPSEDTQALLDAWRDANPGNCYEDSPWNFDKTLRIAMQDYWEKHKLTQVHSYPHNNPPGQLQLGL